MLCPSLNNRYFRKSYGRLGGPRRRPCCGVPYFDFYLFIYFLICCVFNCFLCSAESSDKSNKLASLYKTPNVLNGSDTQKMRSFAADKNKKTIERKTKLKKNYILDKKHKRHSIVTSSAALYEIDKNHL